MTAFFQKQIVYLNFIHTLCLQLTNAQFLKNTDIFLRSCRDIQGSIFSASNLNKAVFYIIYNGYIE